MPPRLNRGPFPATPRPAPRPADTGTTCESRIGTGGNGSGNPPCEAGGSAWNAACRQPAWPATHPLRASLGGERVCFFATRCCALRPPPSSPASPCCLRATTAHLPRGPSNFSLCASSYAGFRGDRVVVGWRRSAATTSLSVILFSSGCSRTGVRCGGAGLGCRGCHSACHPRQGPTVALRCRPAGAREQLAAGRGLGDAQRSPASATRCGSSRDPGRPLWSWQASRPCDRDSPRRARPSPAYHNAAAAPPCRPSPE